METLTFFCYKMLASHGLWLRSQCQIMCDHEYLYLEFQDFLYYLQSNHYQHWQWIRTYTWKYFIHLVVTLLPNRQRQLFLFILLLVFYFIYTETVKVTILLTWLSTTVSKNIAASIELSVDLPWSHLIHVLVICISSCVCHMRLFDVILARFQKPKGSLHEKVPTMHRRHVVTLHRAVWEQHVDPLVL